MKGISYVFYVEVDSEPADVAVFLHRQVPAVLSGVQTVQKIVGFLVVDVLMIMQRCLEVPQFSSSTSSCRIVGGCDEALCSFGSLCTGTQLGVPVIRTGVACILDTCCVTNEQ